MASESTFQVLEIAVVLLLLLLLFVSTSSIAKPLTMLALTIMNAPNIVLGKILSVIPTWLR